MNTNIVNSTKPCPDCLPAQGCLTCDNLSLISSDNSVKITRQTINTNGKCIWNLRVSAVAAPLNRQDTQTIQWQGNGGSTPLKANVKLSGTAGNLLTANSDGLYLSIASISETPNSKLDSPTIAITLAGTASRQIKADLKISQEPGNAFQVLDDGVFVNPSDTDAMYFKPGDVGYPAIGATSFSPSGNRFLNHKLVVFRGFTVIPNSDQGDGSSYFIKPDNSNTMQITPAMTANDFFIIVVL